MLAYSEQPIDLQTVLDTFARHGESELNEIFSNASLNQKNHFEETLMKNLYKNDEFTTWYLENHANMDFIIAVGTLIMITAKLRRGK